MKKYIAIFAVLAFVFATSFAFAGNGMTLTDTDDSIFNQRTNTVRSFTVNHNAATVINSMLVIGANTGGNSLLAGDDVDAGSVNSGDANVVGSEQYDANGLDVVYSCCYGDGGDSNEVVADDTDDSIVNQEEDLVEIEAITSGTYAEANLTTIVGANTGANTAAGGGDVGEDSPVTVDSGTGNVTFDRISVFNLVRITRTAL